MKKRAQDKFSYVTDNIDFENNSKDDYMDDTISDFEKDLEGDMDYLKKEYIKEVEEDLRVVLQSNSCKECGHTASLFTVEANKFPCGATMIEKSISL